MKGNYLPSGRLVVVPENDLEERVAIELMAALAPDAAHRDRLLTKAIHTDDGTFEAYHPDWFYFLERLSSGRFALIASDE